MEPVRSDTTTDRRTAVELAKRLLVDSIWRTAKIEVDGVTFPDTQEIFDGRAPEGMSVDDIVTVNNIKRAWRFLLENIDYPVDWQYIREYNRIIGEGLVRDAGRLREYGVRIGGTGWVPEIPAVESSRERVRGILEESEGEDTAMLLFGAVTRGQWFSDGNKRTALMVANHQLIHDGIGVFSIPPEDKAQFVSMLLRYYETGDYSRLSDWLSQNAVGHVPGGLTKDLKTDQGMSVEPRYVELAFGCPPIEWDIDMRVRDFADRMGDEYTSLYEKGETGIKGGDFERFGAFVDNHLDFMCALTKARAWIPSAATGRSAYSSTPSTSSPQCPNHHRRHRKRTIFLPAYAIRPTGSAIHG